MKQSVVLLLTSFLCTQVQAATIEVGGVCSLTSAITAVNIGASVGGCTFEGEVGELDTIVLPPNIFWRATGIDNESFGPTGFPVITSEMIIQGSGRSGISRSEDAPQVRILAVGPGGDLTLVGVEVHNGVAVTGEGTGADGGGIFVAEGGFP